MHDTGNQHRWQKTQQAVNARIIQPFKHSEAGTHFFVQLLLHIVASVKPPAKA